LEISPEIYFAFLKWATALMILDHKNDELSMVYISGFQPFDTCRPVKIGEIFRGPLMQK
jgi:hypothetical protein